MTAIRKTLLTLNLAMLSLVSLWAYASHRYDGLNVGGEAGDINVWIRIGDVGCYGGILLWVVCILAGLWATAKGKTRSRLEGILWLLIPLIGAPMLLFALNAAFNAGIRVAS